MLTDDNWAQESTDIGITFFGVGVVVSINNVKSVRLAPFLKHQGF